MSEYQNILLKIENRVATITLNRPEVRNALNNDMVKELYNAFYVLNSMDDIRVIVVTGVGNTFCAGADLKWLGEVADFTYEKNYEQSMDLIKLFYLIHDHSKPIIAKVNGSAVGGGVGIMLVSDIIIASDKAKFGLSEVAIGIIPAAIAPFLMNRIGETKAREYFITGERIDAKTAHEIGIINYVCPEDEIDTLTNNKVSRILNNGPNAITKVKEMMNLVRSESEERLKDSLAKMIAELRTSKEGSEGIKSFLNKTKPSWVQND